MSDGARAESVAQERFRFLFRAGWLVKAEGEAFKLTRFDYAKREPFGEVAPLAVFEIPRGKKREIRATVRGFNAGLTDLQTEAIVKLVRHQTRASQAKSWESVIPEPIRGWAWNKIFELQEGLACCDNARVALLGNTGQMRRYKSQKDAGCCGFSDSVHRGPDGKLYTIGFNYGH